MVEKCADTRTLLAVYDNHVELVDLEGYFTAVLVHFVDFSPPTGNMHISVS